ncbi:flavin monoamine oxidase family protein [Roseiflexus sp.]|uniref:flavin monoamine oxidase family protein n=1 Tax=Roseiflexus sp. TaxID=2562120 RepID=UPI00398AA599
MGFVKKVVGARRVVVIGSGLAGLAAARELQRNGFDVVVLEARNRIGGRIWTSNKWPNMPLDMGATWIHGVRGNPITQLADSINATRVATSYDRSIIYSVRGKPLSAVEERVMTQLSTRLFEMVRKAQNRDTDRSILQTVEPLMSEYRRSPDMLRQIRYILSDLEHEYAGSIADLSTHWYDSAKTFGGEDALFVQGFKVIADYLATGVRIEFSQEVKEIWWGLPEVRIVTQNSEFLADHVVVTLPLGVLKRGSVRFMPRLPDETRNAIARIGMGVLNKCFLRFERIFWPDHADWLGYISAEHGAWTEWVSFKRAADMPVLLGFSAAGKGRTIESWSDQQIVASAMQTLRTIFGRSIPDPIDHQITRWASDPFAIGAYSYNALGSHPKMRDTLSRPLNGRLFFAGEATSRDYFGTTHGAYLSGLRAAKDILST